MSLRVGDIPVMLALLTAVLMVATPALCAAGVLKHPCDCSTALDDCDCGDHSGEAACDCSAGCSHDGCENDPCQARLLTGVCGRDVTGPFPALDVTGEPLSCWLSLDTQRLAATSPVYSTTGPPGSEKRIPCHSSDLPLLL